MDVASTRSGASGNAVTTTGATASGVVATTASGATTKTTDGLHPATEAPEATNAMVATTVAMTILTDQAEKEGNKARHHTGGECSLSSPFSVAFFALVG